MLFFSKKEKEAVHRLHLLTGKSLPEVREFYEGLLLDFFTRYQEKEPVTIPLFGDIFFHYMGDEITNKGRKAKIDIDFIPDPFLIKVIGQIEDQEENELEKHLKEKIQKTIKRHIEEDE